MALTHIPADQIVAGLNDRTEFHAGELAKLAAHIAAEGLINPPEVRPLGDGRYQIVSGERRTRAMRDILGWADIPVQLLDLTDEQAVTHMLAENRNRVNLNPIDEARGYTASMARFGWDVATCARKAGTSVRVVSDRLALLALCPEAQALAASGQLSPGYALVLALAAQAGLDRNFQNRALDLLTANPAPALAWWRGIVADLTGAQGQQAFAWGAYAAAQTAAVVQTLPHPAQDRAPATAGAPAAILGAAAAYWEGIAAQYTARGDAAAARDCRLYARGLRAAADVAAAPAVLRVALTGRVGRQVCACGARATTEIARAVPAGAGTRIQIERCCEAHATA